MMLQDPNVEIYVQNAVEPLKKQIAELTNRLNELIKLIPIKQKWVCNSCGFSDYTYTLTEQDLNELQCSNCGEDEFHLENEAS